MTVPREAVRPLETVAPTDSFADLLLAPPSQGSAVAAPSAAQMLLLDSASDDLGFPSVPTGLNFASGQSTSAAIPLPAPPTELLFPSPPSAPASAADIQFPSPPSSVSTESFAFQEGDELLFPSVPVTDSAPPSTDVDLDTLMQRMNALKKQEN